MSQSVTPREASAPVRLADVIIHAAAIYSMAPDRAVYRAVALLLAQMTLAEKVDMLSEKSGAGLSPSRLGIPTLAFADGPAGIRIDRNRRDVNEGKAAAPSSAITSWLQDGPVTTIICAIRRST